MNQILSPCQFHRLQAMAERRDAKDADVCDNIARWWVMSLLWGVRTTVCRAHKKEMEANPDKYGRLTSEVVC